MMFIFSIFCIFGTHCFYRVLLSSAFIECFFGYFRTVLYWIFSRTALLDIFAQCFTGYFRTVLLSSAFIECFYRVLLSSVFIECFYRVLFWIFSRSAFLGTRQSTYILTYSLTLILTMAVRHYYAKSLLPMLTRNE